MHACGTMGAYRKLYSSQQNLIRLIEKWKRQLDKNKIVGEMLVDLSKAFDRIPYDLLIAKIDAYSFDKEAVSLIFLCFKNRKKFVRIKTVLTLY